MSAVVDVEEHNNASKKISSSKNAYSSSKSSNSLSSSSSSSNIEESLAHSTSIDDDIASSFSVQPVAAPQPAYKPNYSSGNNSNNINNLSRTSQSHSVQYPTPAVAAAARPITAQPMSSLLSSSSSSSSKFQLPNPDDLYVYCDMVSQLQLTSQQHAVLSLLLLLLSEVTNVLLDKHNNVIDANLQRRFLLSAEARQLLLNLVSVTRFAEILDFARLARIGLQPASIASLATIVSLHSRFGSDMVDSSRCRESLSTVFTPSELFLLYDYMHNILALITNNNNSEMQEMQSQYLSRLSAHSSSSNSIAGAPDLVPMRSSKSQEPLFGSVGSVAGKKNKQWTKL